MIPKSKIGGIVIRSARVLAGVARSILIAWHHVMEVRLTTLKWAAGNVIHGGAGYSRRSIYMPPRLQLPERPNLFWRYWIRRLGSLRSSEDAIRWCEIMYYSFVPDALWRLVTWPFTRDKFLDALLSDWLIIYPINMYLNPNTVADLFIPMLNHSSIQVRIGAGYMCGWYGDSRVLPYLISILNTKKTP